MAFVLRTLPVAIAAWLIGIAPAWSTQDVQVASILGYGDQLRRQLQGPNYRPKEVGKPADVMLRKAVEGGDPDGVRQALASGANPNYRPMSSLAPLLTAAWQEDHEILDLLLDQGADPSLASGGGHTALHMAAMHGNRGAVERLLAAGAPLDAREEQNHNTPLHYAIRNQGLSVVPLLIAAGADVSTRDKNRNRTPLISAAHRPEATEAIEALLDAGADPNVADKDGWTPIHSAASAGNMAGIELLRRRGADVFVLDQNGWTAVHVAAIDGQAAALESLIQAGVDPLLRSIWDRGALDLAVRFNRIDCVTVLLDHGVDPNTPDRHGRTAVMRAIGEEVEILSLLIARGGDVNVAEKSTGMTALMRAARRGYLNAIGILVDAGANLGARNAEGKTALEIATQVRQMDVVAALEAAARGE